MNDAEIVSLPGDDLEAFQSFRGQHRNLGLGELGAIWVARLRKAVVLTNDRDARKLASELGVGVSDTLGILRHAAGVNLLNNAEAIHVLEEMIKQGSWFGQDLVDEFKRSLL